MPGFHVKKRGGEVGMTEAKLDLAAIRAAFECVMRVGVTNPMGARIGTSAVADRILRG